MFGEKGASLTAQNPTGYGDPIMRKTNRNVRWLCSALALMLIVQTGCTSILSQYAYWADERRFRPLQKRNQFIYGGTVNDWLRVANMDKEKSRWELNNDYSLVVASPFFFIDMLLCIPVDTALLPMSIPQQLATEARQRREEEGVPGEYDEEWDDEGWDSDRPDDERWDSRWEDWEKDKERAKRERR